MKYILSFISIFFLFGFHVSADDSKIPWDDLRIGSNYSTSSEYVEITVTIDNVYNIPDNTYKLSYNIDSEIYLEEFIHNESSNELTVKIITDQIEKSKIRSIYSTGFKILDQNGNIPFSDTNYKLYIGEQDEKVVYDDFSWSPLAVRDIYDEKREKLFFRIILEDIEDIPEYSYSAELLILSGSIIEEFTYDSKAEELYLDIEYLIDPYDLDNTYDINILNTTHDFITYTREKNKIDSSPEDSISWRDSILEGKYDDVSEKLTLYYNLNLSGPVPYHEYELSIHFNDVTKDAASLIYNEQYNTFGADFEIEIEEKYIEETLKYSFEIEKSGSDEGIIYTSPSRDLFIGDEHNVIDDNFQWGNIVSELIHDPETNKNTYVFTLENIVSPPEDEYTMSLTIKDRSYKLEHEYHEVNFIYVEEKGILQGSISTNIGEPLRDYYEINMKIENLDTSVFEFSKYNLQLVPTNTGLVFAEKETQTTKVVETEKGENVSELSVAEKVYNALIESISGKDTSTKIITIKAMLPALAGYKGEYPQLSNTLDEITSLLRNEVKRLNLEGYYSSH